MSTFKQTYRKVNDLINLIHQVSAMQNARHRLVSDKSYYALVDDSNTIIVQSSTITELYSRIQVYYDNTRYSFLNKA